jgi:hypothetical protein
VWKSRTGVHLGKFCTQLLVVNFQHGFCREAVSYNFSIVACVSVAVVRLYWAFTLQRKFLPAFWTFSCDTTTLWRHQDPASVTAPLCTMLLVSIACEAIFKEIHLLVLEIQIFSEYTDVTTARNITTSRKTSAFRTFKTAGLLDTVFTILFVS